MLVVKLEDGRPFKRPRNKWKDLRSTEYWNVFNQFRIGIKLNISYHA
jgi:hypothetical protein